MNTIIDHGEFDYLTPPAKPSEVDQAIARVIRHQFLERQNLRMPDSLPQQMVRNGLSAHDDPFAWLRD